MKSSLLEQRSPLSEVTYRPFEMAEASRYVVAIEAKVYLTHEGQERIDPPLNKSYTCVYLRHKGGSHDKEWHHQYDT